MRFMLVFETIDFDDINPGKKSFLKSVKFCPSYGQKSEICEGRRTLTKIISVTKAAILVF